MLGILLQEQCPDAVPLVAARLRRQPLGTAVRQMDIQHIRKRQNAEGLDASVHTACFTELHPAVKVREIEPDVAAVIPVPGDQRRCIIVRLMAPGFVDDGYRYRPAAKAPVQFHLFPQNGKMFLTERFLPLQNIIVIVRRPWILPEIQGHPLFRCGHPADADLEAAG